MSSAEPVDGIVTLRLPVSLDDEWTDLVGADWRALAAQTGVAAIDLDATDLRSVTARAMGLLTAVRLVAQQRGASLRLRSCPTGLVPAFTAARVDVVAAVPSQALATTTTTESSASLVSNDTGPAWWISAASNA